jgi:hypothetical protein
MQSIPGPDGLEHLFVQVGRGTYPPFDALTEVMPRPSTVPAAVFSFTGHHVVAADVDPDWVQRRCPPGDLVAPITAGRQASRWTRIIETAGWGVRLRRRRSCLYRDLWVQVPSGEVTTFRLLCHTDPGAGWT